MAVSRRLHSSMFDRPDNNEEKPKRIIFLSVEGNKTEKNYFSFVHKYREKLGIEAVVHIETLSRLSKDTSSDPDKVFDLLNDYLAIRNNGIATEEVRTLLSDVAGENYTVDFIADYLSDTNELTKKQRNSFRQALSLAGIDLDYQKFLRDYKGQDGNDIFCVVLDRDKGNHEAKDLEALVQKCKENHCMCLISNPLFEFWLLLHVCDVKKEFAGHDTDLIENKKVSDRHTYVSKALSDRVSHRKSISEKAFLQHYLPNIDLAIQRAADFEQDTCNNLESVGSNIPKLFEVMREKL